MIRSTQIGAAHKSRRTQPKDRRAFQQRSMNRDYPAKRRTWTGSAQCKRCQDRIRWNPKTENARDWPMQARKKREERIHRNLREVQVRRLCTLKAISIAQRKACRAPYVANGSISNSDLVYQILVGCPANKAMPKAPCRHAPVGRRFRRLFE